MGSNPESGCAFADKKETASITSTRYVRYVTADDEFGDPGSTATTLLVTPTHLIFSNVGDSRALLCRGGKIAFCTKVSS